MLVKSKEYWMEKALVLAQEAAANNEVPVGAIVVLNNEIIGKGSNSPIHSSDPTAHAEIIALRQAAKAIDNYRLTEADLYVTLEPCAMCAGAIVHSRIRNLYFGAYEAKAGAVKSNLNLLDQSCMNHKVTVFSGVCEEECGQTISSFFSRRRLEKKAAKVLK
ncbi:MAG: tRNA adenosine(34) deaminase TadA [Oceanospirillaceae bacterium]